MEIFEFLAFILALIFWWTFWDRLNRITIAVERLAAPLTQGEPMPSGAKPAVAPEEKSLLKTRTG